MTVYIYRQAPSEGAVALAAALTARELPARKIRRIPRRWNPETARVVFWGSVFPEYHGDDFAGTLNDVAVLGKLAELRMLTDAGVPTVEFDNGVGAAREGETWLGRANSHIGGADLLAPPARPDYWVKKEDITREYRLHIFRGQSIRAGRKEKFREDAHPWIRSHDAGWHLVYDGHGVTDRHRDAAKQAVTALGLDFGAVDVGERADGSVLVFEVNRAPGLEGNTIAAYATAIQSWANEG